MTLPGFESIPGNGAGSFIGAPFRLVLHTTEGSTADGAIGAYRAHNSWPHFTVDLQRRRRIQHLELDTAARALLHPPGTPETNRANAIQIEMVGFATQTPDWPAADLDWFRDNVVVPIHDVCPFAWNAPAFVAYPQSAGLGAAQRFGWDQWLHFSGICGHEHVSGNDHGDPGAIDVARLLTHPTQPPEDDDMTDAQLQTLVQHIDGLATRLEQLAGELSDIRNELAPAPPGLIWQVDRIAKKLGA